MIKSWVDVVALILLLVLLPLSIKYVVSEFRENKKKDDEDDEKLK